MLESRKIIQLFIIMPRMEGGGAERVISILLNKIDRQKFTPVLILLRKTGKLLSALPDDVEIIDLNVSRVRYSVFKIIKLARKRKPDIIFSNMFHLSVWIIIFRFLMPSHIKFITRETIISSIHNIHLKNQSHTLLRILARIFYNRYDKLICQSVDMLNDMKNYFHVNPQKLVLINNPVDYSYIISRAEYKSVQVKSSEFQLIAMGRLTFQKGFDMLLGSLHLLIKKGENLHLTVLGEGEEEMNLKNMAVSLGIEKQVTFQGFVDNPYTNIAGSDALVLSSRYEGFPNVVLEAHVCGKPVIAFNCPGGVSEIIIPGVNGWLVKPGDIDGMAKTIIFARENPLNREKIIASATDRYCSEIIIPQYEKLFEQVLSE